jgi:hypothetical protein
MEFIVPGAPRSANAGNRSRRRWRDRVSQAAQECLPADESATEQDVSVLIVYLYWGETSLDVDNIAKALLDGLTGILYRSDRQVVQLIVRKSLLIAGSALTGATPYLLEAIERMSLDRSDFVYIRIDPAPDHSRIP